MNVLARKVTNNLIRSTRSALPFSTSNTNSLFHHNNITQIDITSYYIKITNFMTTVITKKSGYQ